MEPPFQPEPQNEITRRAMRSVYLGLGLLVLVLATFVFAEYYNAGLRPAPASTARCRHELGSRSCDLCCRPDLYRWSFGRCSCNVQTR